MKTTRDAKLLLTPENGGLVTMSLTATLGQETLQERRSLLGLSSLWARPEPLRVALSADTSGSWSWAENWTEALADAVDGYELRFVVRGGVRGRR